jgi:hypothetical protein
MKDYTIRFSGGSLVEASDVALRLAEQPESRPTGTDWNVSRSDDTHQLETLVSGVTQPDQLRAALRFAARQLEEGKTTGSQSVGEGAWAQLRPFK